MAGDDELVRAKRLLGTLEDAQRLGIWEWTPATNEMVWSDGLYEILDVSPRVPPTLAGLIATVHPADRLQFEKQLARVRRERGLLAFRCQALGRSGEARPRILHVRMQRTLAEDGSLRSVVGTNQDITDEALATDPTAAVAALTGAIAHEINNPLAIISTVLQMMPQTGPTEDALRAVERIHSVIGDLNLYAHGDRTPRGTIELEQAITMALAQVRDLHARASIVTRFERTGPVRANARALSRVVIELIENALDAVVGTASKEIHIATRSDGREWAVVEVTDSGSGIAPILQGRVFDPFYTTKGVGRRGLGLAICRGIVDSLGGTITIQSHAGGGTRIVVALPATPSQPSTAVTPGSSPSQVTSIDRGHVLIVDDEELFAKAIARLLATEHDVMIVHDGQQALAQIESGSRFDAILCDLMMPVMTGAELYSALTRVAPEQAKRMIFVTGGTLDAKATELLRRVESFEKPCDVTVLRDAVRRRVAASRSG